MAFASRMVDVLGDFPGRLFRVPGYPSHLPFLEIAMGRQCSPEFEIVPPVDAFEVEAVFKVLASFVREKLITLPAR
jgi:hypothetical protein